MPCELCKACRANNYAIVLTTLTTYWHCQHYYSLRKICHPALSSELLVMRIVLNHRTDLFVLATMLVPPTSYAGCHSAYPYASFVFQPQIYLLFPIRVTLVASLTRLSNADFRLDGQTAIFPDRTLICARWMKFKLLVMNLWCKEMPRIFHFLTAAYVRHIFLSKFMQ